MKLKEIIENLDEWRNESAEKRSLLVFIAEKEEDGGLVGNIVCKGKTDVLLASIVESMLERPSLFRLVLAAVRIAKEELNQNHEEEDNE